MSKAIVFMHKLAVLLFQRSDTRCCVRLQTAEVTLNRLLRPNQEGRPSSSQWEEELARISRISRTTKSSSLEASCPSQRCLSALQYPSRKHGLEIPAWNKLGLQNLIQYEHPVGTCSWIPCDCNRWSFKITEVGGGYLKGCPEAIR